MAWGGVPAICCDDRNSSADRAAASLWLHAAASHWHLDRELLRLHASEGEGSRSLGDPRNDTVLTECRYVMAPEKLVENAIRLTLPDGLVGEQENL